MSKSVTWSNGEVPLGSLQDWEKNPAKISPKDAEDLSEGIHKYGFILPFVAAAPPPKGKGKIPLVDGHQRKAVSLQLLKLSPETLVDIRIPSRTLSEKEKKEISIRLRKNTGEFDEEKLRTFFERDELLEAGFDEEELEGWDFDLEEEVSDMDSDFEEEGEEEAREDRSGLIGIPRPRWSSKRGKRFLALRSFTTERKKKEIEWLKRIKQERPKDISRAIAREISSALLETFGTLSGFILTSAPNHVTGFSRYLGELVARDLGVDFVEVFTTDQEAGAPRRIFGSERPAVRAKKVKKGIVWIDDTLTTGQTLEACRLQVSGVFIPIVWIYDDAKERPGDE